MAEKDPKTNPEGENPLDASTEKVDTAGDQISDFPRVDTAADPMSRLINFGIQQDREASAALRLALKAEIAAKIAANPDALDEIYSVTRQTLEFLLTNVPGKVLNQLDQIENLGLRLALQKRKPGTIVIAKRTDFDEIFQNSPFIPTIHPALTQDPEAKEQGNFTRVTVKVDFTEGGFKLNPPRKVHRNVGLVSPGELESRRPFTFIRGRDLYLIFHEIQLVLDNPAMINSADLRAHIANRRSITVAFLENDKSNFFEHLNHSIDTNAHATVSPGEAIDSIRLLEICFDPDSYESEIALEKYENGESKFLNQRRNLIQTIAEQRESIARQRESFEYQKEQDEKSAKKRLTRRTLLSAAAGAIVPWSANEMAEATFPGYRKWRDDFITGIARAIGLSPTPEPPSSSPQLKPEPTKADPPGKTEVQPARNGNEILADLRALPGIEAVFAASLRQKHDMGNFSQDHLLDPYEVNRHFSGNRFQYTGMPENQGDYAGTNPGDTYSGQRIHRFTALGNRSKYLGKNGEAAGRFSTTTLADAINDLLDYANPKLSTNNNYEIRKWIVWTYEKSFNVRLDINRFKIQRDRSTKKVVNIIYNPPQGFDSKIGLNIYERIQGVAASSAESQYTRAAQYFSVLGGDNRLLLQSGISPNHDLYVPEGLLDHDKKFVLKLPSFEAKTGETKSGEWKLDAGDLKFAIDWHEGVRLSNPGFVVDRAYGDPPKLMNKVSPYIPLNDPIVRGLADYICEGLKTPQEEVQAIVNFVQALGYIGENDQNFDRHPLLSLFNGGSDCNNLTIIWSALMAARGHEHYLLYSPCRPISNYSHLLVAVPDNLAPNWQVNLPEGTKSRTFNGAPVVELTGKYKIGTTHLNDTWEIMAGERFKKVAGKWEIKKILPDGTSD